MELLPLIAACIGLVTALINLFIALRNSTLADKKKKDSKRLRRLKSRKKNTK